MCHALAIEDECLSADYEGGPLVHAVPPSPVPVAARSKRYDGN